MAYQNRVECYVCEARLMPRAMIHLGGENNNPLRQEIAVRRRDEALRLPLNIALESRICINCNRLILQEIEMLENHPECTRLNIISQTSSQTCLICNARENIHRLSLKCRIDIFLKRNIYVPEYNVICNHHLDERGCLLDFLQNGLRSVYRPFVLKGVQLQQFLQELRTEMNRKVEHLYDHENNFSDSQFKALTPLNKVQFNDLFNNYCQNLPNDQEQRQRSVTKKDLLCFLCKLKQGISDDFLCSIFRYSSRQATSLAVSSVRKLLIHRFAPENVGFNAIPRPLFIENHVTDFSNCLYNQDPENRKAIVYMDCTYLEIEKSSCFQALRQSYSVQKQYHLLKPLMITGPDGYILDIRGPYFSNSTNNDARILIQELDNNFNGMEAWFQPGDVAVLDRGYRDAVHRLENIGMTVKMPPFLQRGQSQFTTEDANAARIITSTRNIVEARNGHLKSIFKFFSNVIATSHVYHLADFLRIACAIINRYRPTITRRNSTVQTAELMLQKSEEANVVQARVENERLATRRERWTALLDQHAPLFPHLNLDFLQEFSFGTYQLYLSPSYIQDTFLRADINAEDNDQALQIDSNTNEPGFLRFRIFSRFRRNASHQLWIAYNQEYALDNEDNFEPILGHYCTCKYGARTVGACAHVAAVIWYLGYARHQENVKYPSILMLQHIMNVHL